jgi:serine/threonine-protein phosphatase 2A regulatory subunit B''
MQARLRRAAKDGKHGKAGAPVRFGLLKEQAEDRGGSGPAAATTEAIPANLLRLRHPARRKTTAAKAFPDETPLLAMRRRVRLAEIEKRLARILTDEDLDVLWEVLQDNSDEEEGKMTYDQLAAARRDAGTRRELRGKDTDRYFTPDIFLKFRSDEQGCVAVEPFFQHLELRVRHETNRLNLSKFDSSCDGTLSRSDVEAFLRSVVPHLPEVSRLSKSDLEDWLIHASTRFFYFNDPHKRGRIGVREAAHSQVTHEVADLRLGKVAPEHAMRNWFTKQFFERVREEFRELDTTQSGSLGLSELEAFREHDLTHLFVQRVFETVDLGRAGEFRYPQWIEFVLVMSPESRWQDGAMLYLWRCIDIHGRGYLTVADVNAFFREMNEKLHNQKPPTDNILTEDIVGEVFDMTKPKDPYHIRLEDIKAEGKIGKTALAMLVSLSAFWQYEMREQPQ